MPTTPRRLRNAFQAACVFFCALFIPVALADTPAADAYAGGDGSTGAPYQIATLAQLRRLSETPADWASHFVLTADIDAADTASWNGGEGFAPIGDGLFGEFNGTFDGAGFAISGLTVNRPNGPSGAAGLFAYAGEVSVIRNVALEGVAITGGIQTGGLVGRTSGDVLSSSVSGSVSGDNPGTAFSTGIGGLVGIFAGDQLTDCGSDATVSGVNRVGGLVGWLRDDAEIARSHARGSVTGGSRVGGLVGHVDRVSPDLGATVSLSHASATVSGGSDVGGLVGLNEGTVSESHAAGQVPGGVCCGGLVGANSAINGPGIIRDSYWDRERSGTDIGIGNDPTDTGATGLSGEEALQQASYPAFDFVDDWRIADGATHPFLAGEQTPTALAFSAGSGTEADPYVIRSLAELRLLSEPPASAFWRFHYTLEADIDASETATWNGGRGFSPIGNWVTGEWFSGSFDGRGHTITGLTIDRPVDTAVGLFAFLQGPGARVSNLRLDQAMIRGGSAVGALVGWLGTAPASALAIAQPGEVIDCSVTGSVSGNSRVGGLVGNSEVSSIRSSSVSANVTGNLDVGGLVGRSFDSEITSSHAKGRVSGPERVGGLVGTLANGSLIESYAMADVLGGDRIGGLVAENTRGTISACFATGNVTGGEQVGGLFGLNSGRVTDSYALGRVFGTAAVGGLGGGNTFFFPVTAAYAAGRVTGDSDVGGLIGSASGTVANYVTDGYWDTDSAGTDIGIGNAPVSTAATGLDGGAMVRQASFAGFDFAATWGIVEGLTRPFLQWQAALDAAGPPTAPVIVDGLARDGAIELQLAASGDPAVVGYRATCVDDLGSVHTGLGGPTSVVVTGLANGVAYDCEVVAIDTSSELSDPAAATGSLTPESAARLLSPILQLLLGD